MKANKPALLAAAVATLGVATLMGANTVSAQTTGDSLIDKVATRFNLNRDEVEQAFEEYQDERHEERMKDVAEYLQEKVDAGSITAEQKTLIETKLAEMHDEHEADREALQQWADDNDVSMRYLMGRGHGVDLEDAVANGDITAEQRAAIEAKRDEVEAERTEHRAEMQQWAEENNIDLQDVMPMGGEGGRGMGRGGMHR